MRRVTMSESSSPACPQYLYLAISLIEREPITIATFQREWKSYVHIPVRPDDEGSRPDAAFFAERKISSFSPPLHTSNIPLKKKGVGVDFHFLTIPVLVLIILNVHLRWIRRTVSPSPEGLENKMLEVTKSSLFLSSHLPLRYSTTS
jgi:hypothetical protein